MDGANQDFTQLGDGIARATRLVAEGRYEELVELAKQLEIAQREVSSLTADQALDLRGRLAQLTEVMQHVSAVHSALSQIEAPAEYSYGADGAFEEPQNRTLRGEA